MAHQRTLAAALVLALAWTPLAAWAQQAEVEEDPVVARVNGDEVRRSEVLTLASRLPPQYQSQIVQIYPLLVQRVIDFRLAGRAGREAGLAENEEVKRRTKAAEREAIRDLYLEQKIEAGVTEETLKARYEEMVEETPPVTERKARHILLETEDAAKEVIAELDEGADFAELAKEHSTGPSAEQGGDLGYFTSDQMVPEFSQAAEKLEPGEYSEEPVKSEFGWHVIKVEDRREKPAPSFDELEPQLREEASRAIMDGLIKELRSQAEIEVLPAGEALVLPEPQAETAQ